MSDRIDHLSLYRLPWNYADNIISWLEPTSKCNLRCEGCYRDPESTGHKSLDEVREDLETFRRLRRSDCISIAGGDPLVYPHILETVALVREMGWKAIINTNGVALDEPLLRELKKAGVYGFTFHIDTTQKRPKVAAATETELNEVRLHYARMLHEAGDIACSFNSTVSERTVHEVPAMVRWAESNAHLVDTMVFILFRSPVLSGDFDFYAGTERIDLNEQYKESSWGGERVIFSPEVASRIREADPLYEPCAYLNGTARPDSFKWLLADRLVMGGRTVGYVSPRFMEIVQTMNHLFTGRYLSYARPRVTARGKTMAFLTGLVDGRMRRLFFRILGRTLKNPANLFRRARVQSIMIIQPVNIEEDGRQDMCDACPDVTVFQGKLVWSCRLEELNEHGTFVNAVPTGRKETPPPVEGNGASDQKTIRPASTHPR